jgi:hypothetical protein
MCDIINDYRNMEYNKFRDKYENKFDLENLGNIHNVIVCQFANKDKRESNRGGWNDARRCGSCIINERIQETNDIEEYLHLFITCRTYDIFDTLHISCGRKASCENIYDPSCTEFKHVFKDGLNIFDYINNKQLSNARCYSFDNIINILEKMYEHDQLRYMYPNLSIFTENLANQNTMHALLFFAFIGDMSKFANLEEFKKYAESKKEIRDLLDAHIRHHTSHIGCYNSGKCVVCNCYKYSSTLFQDIFTKSLEKTKNEMIEQNLGEHYIQIAIEFLKTKMKDQVHEWILQDTRKTLLNILWYDITKYINKHSKK